MNSLLCENFHGYKIHIKTRRVRCPYYFDESHIVDRCRDAIKAFIKISFLQKIAIPVSKIHFHELEGIAISDLNIVQAQYYYILIPFRYKSVFIAVSFFSPSPAKHNDRDLVKKVFNLSWDSSDSIKM